MPEEIALFNGGGITDPNAMVDYVQWLGSLGPREPVANAKGIWTLDASIGLGDTLSYTGDGTDTENREGLWLVENIKVRVHSVDAINDRFTLKNYDSKAVDVSGWLFTTGRTNLKLNGVILSVDSGSTNLTPGASVTLKCSDSNLLKAAGGSLAVFRGAVLSETGMVDYVQWIIDDGLRESMAINKGIWSRDASLPSGLRYEYYGNGTDAGTRESLWTDGVVPQGVNANPHFTVTAEGQVRLDFDVVIGRVYEIQSSENLHSWNKITPRITPGGPSATWTDPDSLATKKRRYYRVVDATYLP